MGYEMVMSRMTSRDLKGQTHDPNTLRSQYLENGWRWDSVLKDHQYKMAYGGIKCDVRRYGRLS